MSNTKIVNMLLQGQNDLEWFNANLDKLKSKYNNMFVAFENHEIIDADSSLETLMDRLNKKNVDISSMFIEFISDIKFIL